MSNIGDDELADLLAGVDDSEEDDSDTDAFLDELEKPIPSPQAGSDEGPADVQATREQELADILGDASDDSDERDADPPLRIPPPLPSFPASLPNSSSNDQAQLSLQDPPETAAVTKKEELAELLADFDDSSDGSCSEHESNDEALPKHLGSNMPSSREGAACGEIHQHAPPPPEEAQDEQRTAQPARDTLASTRRDVHPQQDAREQLPITRIYQEQPKESTPQRQPPSKAVHQEKLLCNDLADLPPREDVDLEALCKLSEVEHHLNLQNLQLRSLRLNSAQALPSTLTSLCLSGNAFGDMAELAEQLSPLTKLIELDLSRCRLTRLPDFPRLPCLVHLDISKNSLLSCVGLYKCSSLQRLSLSRNRLHRLEQLEMLLQLEELDVSQNHLGPTAQALRNVAACTKLRAMWVEGNPLTKDRSHRGLLLSLFPSLILLDDDFVRPQRLPAHKPTAKGNAKAKATKAQGCAHGGSSRDGMSYSLLARGLQAQVQQPRRPAARAGTCKAGTSDQEPKRPPRYTKPTKSSKLMRQAKYEPDSDAEHQEYAFGSRFSPPRREPAKVSAKPRPHRASSKADRRGDTGSSPTQEQPIPALAEGLGLHPQTLALVPPLPVLNSDLDIGPSRNLSAPGLQSQDSGKAPPQSPVGPAPTPQAHSEPGFATLLGEKRRLLQQVSMAPPVAHPSLASSERPTLAPQVHPEPGLAALLGEKRRLLQQVSAKLGGGVVNAVLGHGAEPSASSPVPEGDLSQEADELNSLRHKLRGGIDRKRALLNGLQRS